MDIALYIALGVLVAGAVAMQVWMLRTASGSMPDSKRPLLTFIRALNVVLLLVAALLVAYAVLGR